MKKNLIGLILCASALSFSVFATDNFNILDQAPSATIEPGADVSDGVVTSVGTTAPRSLENRFTDTFNIRDFGAVCDGTTNDNTAINAAITAAASSTAYTNNNAVVITGPAGPSSNQNACIINSLDLTGFTLGTGANTRPRVTFRDMTLLCTGAGNVCFDALGSKLIRMQNVSIRGDSTAPPSICVQIGVKDATSAAWHQFENVHCNNEFTFTALYNMGSEDVTSSKSMWVNAHTSSGPINALGAITGGSGYTNGVYTNVVLTGGAGAGALADITVAGGSVTIVTITYQGKAYAAGNTLSAAAASIGGTGSGFSVPVSSIVPYSVVVDGQNYWRSSSVFTTQTISANTWNSPTLVHFQNSSIRKLGGVGVPMWTAWSGGMKITSSFMVTSSADACLHVFDNGLTKSGILGPDWGLDLQFNCETSGSTGMIKFVGKNSARTYHGFRLRGYHQGSVSAFQKVTNITSIELRDADIEMTGTTSSTPLFDAPSAYSVIGRVAVPVSAVWDTNATHRGSLYIANEVAHIGNSLGISPTVTFAGIPSASISGRIYRVSDANNALLISDGSSWRPVDGVFLLAKSAVATSHTGNTNETVLATISLPAGLLGNNGCFRVYSSWSITNSANTKNIRVRLGGVGGTSVLSIGSTTVAHQQVTGLVCNRNSESSQVAQGEWARGTDLLMTSGAVTTAAINTASAQDIVLTAQLTNTGETVTLEQFYVEILK